MTFIGLVYIPVSLPLGVFVDVVFSSRGVGGLYRGASGISGRRGDLLSKQVVDAIFDLLTVIAELIVARRRIVVRRCLRRVGPGNSLERLRCAAGSRPRIALPRNETDGE